MALCISYLSPWRIAKEGAGNRYEGLWFDVVSRKGLLDGGLPAGFGIVHILNLSGPGFSREGALRVRTARR